MSKAVLPAKLLLRNTYRLLSSSSSWDSDIYIDDPTISDLTWWITALKSWNGFVLKPHKQSIQLETDASATGWGSCIGNLETSGLWDKSMAVQPSNFRELAAVYLTLTYDHPNGFTYLQLGRDAINLLLFKYMAF